MKLNKVVLGTIFGLALMGSGAAHASLVAFDAATETFAQPGPWTASLAIDGNPSGNYINQTPNGWAIQDPNSLTTDLTPAPRSAYFRFQNTVALTASEGLQFQLYQLFNDNGGNEFHTLGAFNLSFTTSNLSGTFDLTNAQLASWTTLIPISFSSAPPLNASYVATGGDILVNNPGLAQAIYTITAQPGVSGITGIRLTALPDSSLPSDGPGFAPSNGNFVLNEITASVVAVPLPASAGVGFGMLVGFGGLFAARKRLSRRPRIA